MNISVNFKVNFTFFSRINFIHIWASSVKHTHKKTLRTAPQVGQKSSTFKYHSNYEHLSSISRYFVLTRRTGSVFRPKQDGKTIPDKQGGGLPSPP